MPSFIAQTAYLGHATRDMTTRVTKSGKDMGVFAIAINDRDEHATFLDIVVFGKQLEWVDVEKGDLILSYGGTLTTEEYNGKRSFKLVNPRIFNVSKYKKRGSQEQEEEVADIPF